ncbi:MAG: ABC-type phosphate transport system substrate-binding protein [Arenicella sp.]|jgi:ABC-type phosphate transport system substrate-binding protein
MQHFKVLLVFLLLFTVGKSFAQGKDTNAGKKRSLVIIVNPSVPQDTISTEDLRLILLGDIRFWDSGGRVTLLIQAPVSWERDTVLGKVMEMSEPQYRQFWISKVFRTEAASGPKVVLSNEMAGILVSRIPGAIAFVDDAEIPPDAKVLKVDGFFPGDEAYPLVFK